MRLNNARKWLVIVLAITDLFVLGFSMYNVQEFQYVVTNGIAQMIILFAPAVSVFVLIAMLCIEYQKAGSDI